MAKWIEKILNPLTNRMILFGGSKHTELVKNGVEFNHKTRKLIPKNPEPEELSVPKFFQPYLVDYSKNSWKTKKPVKISEKKNLKDKCGKSCFLDPKNLRYIICNKQMPCKYNCTAINNVMKRSKAANNQPVFSASKTLKMQYNC
jgi:hypothetical protein